jgi:hypothetical protein
MSDGASAAWGGLQDAMRQAEAELSAAAPDEETKAEGLGYLARLFASTMETVFSPHERTVGGIYFGWMKLGGYNPDYVMGRAQIDAKGTYRLIGRANGADRLGIGIYTATAMGLDLDDYTSVDKLDVDADGRFTVEIGAGLQGRNTLSLKPTSNSLMTRELVLRSGAQRPQFELIRTDAPATPRSPVPVTPQAMEAMLTATGAQVLLTLRRFLHWTEVIASRPNEMTMLPDELDKTTRGDPDTRYCSAYFDLGPDEAFEIELPDVSCAYTAIQAVNHWLEPIAGANLNHTTWRADADGVVRIVVARREPGRPNWLNVGGRRRGAMLYRTVGADADVIPRTRVVTLAS